MRKRLSKAKSIYWTLTLGLPACVLGGVPPLVVPISLLLVGLSFVFVSQGNKIQSDRQAGFWIFVVAAAVCCLQGIPGGALLRPFFAPELERLFQEPLVSEMAAGWRSFSPTPMDALFEVFKLLALSGVFVLGGYFGWRRSVGAVAVTGTFVAMIGLLHSAFDANAIGGIYVPHDLELQRSKALLTTFVNSNHQSSLFLLGGSCALALGLDLKRQADGPASIQVGAWAERDRTSDFQYALFGAALIQWTALLLSLSRGALVVSVLLIPVLFVLVLGEGKGGWWKTISRGKGLLLSLFALLFLAAGLTRTALWGQLKTLLKWSEPETASDIDSKVRLFLDSLRLGDLSPWLGIGRGAFIDLFPQYDSLLRLEVVSYLECYPLAILIEYGWVFGGIILVGFICWWGQVLYSLLRRKGTVPQLISFVGFSAVLLHNLVDFNLEFLGVGLPASALAGSLSPQTPRRSSSLQRRKLLRWGFPGIFTLAALACLFLVPHVSGNRRGAYQRARKDNSQIPKILSIRPLDARVYKLWAYEHAERADWGKSQEALRVAAQLLPQDFDVAWLQFTVYFALGQKRASRRELRRAISLLQRPLSELHVRELLKQMIGGPEDLAFFVPSSLVQWRWLKQSLEQHVPVHQRSGYLKVLASSRLATFPLDHDATYLQYQLAAAGREHALALHFARLLVPSSPGRAAGYLALAQAYLEFRPRRIADAIQSLERALTFGVVEDAHERVKVQQELCRILLLEGSEDSLRRAQSILSKLVDQPGGPRDHQLRKHLNAQMKKISGG